MERAVRLAWLPAEGYSFPEVAAVLNSDLEGARLLGVDYRFKAPVSMEVAQLSLECIQPTPTCYAKVGRSLEASRLLWADLAATGEGGRGLKVTLVLFDVDGGKIVRRSEAAFEGKEAAMTGLDRFVRAALAGVEPMVAGGPSGVAEPR